MVTDEELLALAKEAPEPDAGDAPVEGACEVCEGDAARRARYRCVRCERGVCAGHYWVMLGLCHGCATEADVAAFRQEARKHPREYLGIKWVED